MESSTAAAAPTSSYSVHAGLSKVWKTTKTHTGIYTGGKVELFYDNQGHALLACMLHDDIAIVDAVTGELKRTLQQDVEDEETKESFVTFAVRPAVGSQQKLQLVTAGRNLLLRLWDLETFACIKTIKAHQTPVLAMDFDPSGTLLATGSSDRTVKVFDLDKGFCTHNFRKHTGIVTVVKFHPDPKKLQLVSCGDDATVRVWDLFTQQEVACISDHMNPATCVAFSLDGYTLLTSGRDKVVNFWDLRAQKLRQTVLVHEAIEGIQVIPESFACVASRQPKENKNKKNDTATEGKPIYFVTAGEEGAIKLWCLAGQSCQPLFTQKAESESLKFAALLLSEKRKELLAVSADQNFLIFNDKLERTTQIIGFNDDILNLKYVPNEDGSPSPQLAAATNSDQIRLLNRETMSCELLSGHTDIVMALAVSPDGKWLVSASKDRTARVWDLATRKCVSVCVGHTEALGAIAISQKMAHFAMGMAFFVTGSADKTLKMWSLKPLTSAYNAQGKSPVEIKSITTLCAVKAHEKDVNAIAVSPNDRLVASASQDKLIKVWATNESKTLTLVGTCRGHKRGVWAVEFSPVDQCIASASGDKSVKIWSAKDFTCLKTFEGHTASVLNVQFVCAGMQLMSAGADGLVKLWTIKSNECEATLDNHMDKIWALAVAKDGSEMASGGADSTINLWKDFTQVEEQLAQEDRDSKLLKEQELVNCLRNDKLLEAVQIAFELGHPNRLLQILNDLLNGPRHQDFPTLPGSGKTGLKPDFDTFTPEQIFTKVVTSLTTEQLHTLFDWIKDWNTNARHTGVTQVLISTILREIPPQKLKQIAHFTRTLEALIAYSDRHFQRMDRMLQKSYLVDFSVVSMKSLLPLGEPASGQEESESEDESEEEEQEEEEEQDKEEEESRTKRKRTHARPTVSLLAKKMRA